MKVEEMSITMEEEPDFLLQQVQIALAKVDSEALARSLTDESVSDSEKEIVIKELEHKEEFIKHMTEISSRDLQIAELQERETSQQKIVQKLTKENTELKKQSKILQDQFNKNITEYEALKEKFKLESSLKVMAVSRLAEIIHQKDENGTGTELIDDKRKDKDYQKLQLKLRVEKDKNSEVETKLKINIDDLNEQLLEEKQMKICLRKEIDRKDNEIKELQDKLNKFNGKTKDSGL